MISNPLSVPSPSLTRGFQSWSLLGIAACVLLSAFPAVADEPSPADAVQIWPDQPPNWNAPEQPEADQSGPNAREVAGRRVIRLGNVRQPELHLYPAQGSDTAVVVCPGGGFSILAWDLEGTEIAQWLQRHGVSAAVLKYRVPTRQEAPRWKPPVQDVQRSLALIRSGAVEDIPAKHVGVLGFSAGGHAAVRSAFVEQRLYQPVDEADQASPQPDFAALIYAAYLTESRESETLSEDFRVDGETVPMFFAHAYDDPHTCMGALALFAELKRHNVPASLHVFSSGGHGFGARDTDEEKDLWLPLFCAWLSDRGF